MTQRHEPWRLPNPAGPAAASPATRGESDALADALLLTMAIVSVVFWAVLYRWYSVFAHIATPYYAFEKLPGQFDSPILRQTVIYFLIITQAYFVGYWLIKRAGRITGAVKLAVLVFVLGPGVANVLLYPMGALDVFNYMVEVKLAFFYGHNPYVTTFDAYRSDPFATSSFLPHVTLFYGPVWLILSGLPAVVVGLDDPLRFLIALKTLNWLLLGLTALAIYRYQDDERRGWLAAYAFLANPLVLFEGVANAHNDVMMTVFLVAGLLALKRRSWLAAPLLTLSALVKFFTVVLVPLFALTMLLERWSWRKIALPALVSAALVVAAIAPFWAGGQMLEGLSQGTRISQEMDHVSPYSLVQQYVRERYPPEEALPRVRRAFQGLLAAAMLLVLWARWRGRATARATAVALLLFFLLFTNYYPWYLIPVIAVLALDHDGLDFTFIAAASALGLVYYPLYVWAHFHSNWPRLQVHLFFALLLTVPLLLFLALELGRWWLESRAGKGREACEGEAAAT